jgi:hypothetical protein
MVGISGSLALTPPRGPPLIFSNIDGGRSQISSNDTSQGGRRLSFLALVVDGPISLAPAPPRGPAVDVF